MKSRSRIEERFSVCSQASSILPPQPSLRNLISTKQSAVNYHNNNMSKMHLDQARVISNEETLCDSLTSPLNASVSGPKGAKSLQHSHNPSILSNSHHFIKSTVNCKSTPLMLHIQND